MKTGEKEARVRWRGFKGIHEELGEVEEKRERGWWKSDWIRNKKSWRKGARKLHLQFGHAGKEKLKRQIEEGYERKKNQKYVEGYKKVTEKACDKCETHKIKKESCSRTSHRKFFKKQ